MEDSAEVIRRFETFFSEFIDDNGNRKYDVLISQMELNSNISLVIDYDDLLRFDTELARGLLNSPELYIDLASLAIRHRLRIINEEFANSINKFHARFKNLEPTNRINLRKIRAIHIGKLIQISGILTRVNKVSPLMIRGVFKCLSCNDAIIPVDQEDNEFTRPLTCPQCNRKGPFKLILERSTYIDWQKIRVQEKPEELPAGQMPRSLDGYLLEDLVDVARPGDRVIIIGILKAKQESTQQGKLTIFRTFLDINYIEKLDMEIETLEITPEEEQKIIELSQDPWIYRKLIRSLVPSIYGLDEVKEALLLQLFSGVSRKRLDGTTRRGQIHILLVGDPGVGKSQILKSIAEIAPRGLYASGKGTSAAGLTASVLRDKDTGSLSLEAGVLVLADQGLAAIDEFDKMRTEDRAAIHESMEQLCFHPNTEILLSNGKKVKIGNFVDKLIESNKESVINGINCEILPVQNYSTYSTNFKSIFKSKINRVSRHKAPNHFYKISFSNGRKIIVTPEHPIYRFNGFGIECINASDCVENDFVPAPRYLPNSSIPISLDSNLDYISSHSYFSKLSTPSKHSNISNFSDINHIQFPKFLTHDLANYIAHFISVNHSYNPQSSEFIYINKNNLITEFQHLLKTCFNIKASQYNSSNGLITLQYSSTILYTWIKRNFPEIITNSTLKRIPSKVLGASRSIARSFLSAAFKISGFLDSTSIYYTAISEDLSQDYQDLLLKLGIHSSIHFNHENSLYKIYIKKNSIKIFFKEIIQSDNYFSEKRYRQFFIDHDDSTSCLMYPKYFYDILLEYARNLRLKYTEFHSDHFNKYQMVSREVIEDLLEQLNNKLNSIENLDINNFNINDLQEILNHFQVDIPQTSILKKELIEINSENKEYCVNKGEKILLKNKIEEIRTQLNLITNILQSDIICERITKIEKIINQNENFTPWVYDITIEPYHTFISHGLILHNTVSIAKAGIIATLNSRTSILAAANPYYGRYDEFKTVAENIKRLPPTILSRFDLIFLLRDRPNPENDERMADFILNTEETPPEPPIDFETLKNYIYYAKKHCKPSITPEAVTEIKQFYLQTRISGAEPDTPVPITARYLEALIRLAEARAKICLHDEITAEDAQSVIQLMVYSLGQVGIDSETGISDIDAIETGITTTRRRRLEQLNQLIRQLIQERHGEAVSIEEIKEAAFRLRIPEEQVEEEINNLRARGVIYMPRDGYYKLVEE
ncbi:MAG: LAGLIDADG family homing endonuclease [Candidatus Helarchaeota archaeon]